MGDGPCHGESGATTRRVLHDLAAIEGLRGSWTRLRALGERAAPNADIDRFLATVRGLGDGVEAWVAVSEREGRVVALVAGRRTRRRPVVTIGYARLPMARLRCVDVVYTGVLHEPGEDGAREAAALLALAVGPGGGDVLILNHVDPTLGFVSGGAWAIAQQRRARFGKREPHWRFDFAPGGWDATLARFSSKHRYNLRRADRLLHEAFGGDVRVREFSRAEDIDVFARGTAGLAARTYQAALGAAFQDTPLWRALLSCESGAGRLRCYWLECAGELAAFQIGTVYDGVYYLETIGHDERLAKHSPGTALLLKSFEALCGEGVRTVDYGFGDAGYKRVYGSASWEEATLSVYGAGLRARIALAFDVVSSSVSARLAARAGERSVSGRVKRWWRARLRSRHGSAAASQGGRVDGAAGGGGE